MKKEVSPDVNLHDMVFRLTRGIRTLSFFFNVAQEIQINADHYSNDRADEMLEDVIEKIEECLDDLVDLIG